MRQRRAHLAVGSCGGLWRMCSRLSLECEEPRFNVAVQKVAHLQATRQTSRDESHERARNACATSAPTYLATLTSMRKRAAPAGDDNSSTGSNHGQEASKSASHEALESTDRRSLLQGSHFR